MRKTITETMIKERLARLDRFYGKALCKDHMLDAKIIKILIREYKFMLAPDGNCDPITFMLPEGAEEYKE
jgi:hypothetical protein